MGRKLKKYDVYINKLELYAQLFNIRIFRRTEPSDGAYNANNNSITLDPDLDESEEVSTLLHELGHAFDANLISHGSGKIWAAYQNLYSDDHTKGDLDLVLDAERRAWNNGRIIAKRLGIRLGKWYDKERTSALANYRRS